MDNAYRVIKENKILFKEIPILELNNTLLVRIVEFCEFLGVNKNNIVYDRTKKNFSFILNEESVVLSQDNFMINNYLFPEFRLIECREINHVSLSSLSLFNYMYIIKDNTLTIFS